MTRAARSLLGLLFLASSLSACQTIPRNEFDYDSIGEDEYQSSSDADDEVPVDPPGDGDSFTIECNPADENDCDPDQKCAVVLDTNNEQTLYKCVENDAYLSPFEICELSVNDGQDGCPSGTLCISISEDDSFGRCLPGCLETSQCDANGVCLSGPFSDINHCATACDPLEAACPGGMRCLAAVDRFGCQIGTEFDNAGQADECLGFDERGCAEGFVCQWGELIPNCLSASGMCCTSLCDASGDGSECPSPTQCFALFPNPAPGFEELGVCLVPA